MSIHEWAPYSIAGAFLIGAVAGFVAGVRVVRMVWEHMKDKYLD